MPNRAFDPRPRAVRTLGPQPAPPGLYAPKFTANLGARICARLAAGESLRAICRADPSMPTEKTVWNWRRGRPAFAAAYARAMMRARTTALAAQSERDGLRRAEVMAGLRAPSGRVAWNRGHSGYSAAAAAWICHGLYRGRSLQEVCGQRGAPCVATVYNWMRADPAFREAYRRAKARACYWIVHDAMQAEARWMGSYGASMRLARKVEKAALRRCAWLAPKRYAEAIYGVQPAEQLGSFRPAEGEV